MKQKWGFNIFTKLQPIENENYVKSFYEGVVSINGVPSSIEGDEIKVDGLPEEYKVIYHEFMSNEFKCALGIGILTVYKNDEQLFIIFRNSLSVPLIYIRQNSQDFLITSENAAWVTILNLTKETLCNYVDEDKFFMPYKYEWDSNLNKLTMLGNFPSKNSSINLNGPWYISTSYITDLDNATISDEYEKENLNDIND